MNACGLEADTPSKSRHNHGVNSSELVLPALDSLTNGLPRKPLRRHPPDLATSLIALWNAGIEDIVYSCEVNL